MSSSAVRSSAIELVFAVLALVLGAGLEVSLPRFLGVGFPVLLAVAQFAATRRPAGAAVLCAIAAGAMEDALSGLPAMTSVSYFLLATALARWAGHPRGVTVLTYPGYQIWLSLWVTGLAGNVFTRILVSIPIGLATVSAAVALLAWGARKAAFDGRH